MAFVLSLLLVFGTAVLVVSNFGASEDGRAAWATGQMIHAQYPWLLLASLVGGAVLGLVSLRNARWRRWPVVATECFVAAIVVWYVASYSWLPERSLNVAVGDDFPAYSLLAHDAKPRSFDAGADIDDTGRLYIFYRGDW